MRGEGVRKQFAGLEDGEVWIWWRLPLRADGWEVWIDRKAAACRRTPKWIEVEWLVMNKRTSVKRRALLLFLFVGMLNYTVCTMDGKSATGADLVDLPSSTETDSPYTLRLVIPVSF